ncbi:alpha subunit of 6-phosphofructokinase [Suhomyces tanzawaensis NRRL Y-17324]|uniref:ATP-dependent 6-phosphofructokinase n=1 Tax=Suhomyces tanzawaensis NRRL Y-17324 TaxID=984487 RepID=A0A1E4SGV7_9ASCO|nr:alpha subunit of 6-phosphofructokinase [Suhomyces tanzawaensis NRRL Y-17324]ODV78741.1 alpha subunit of 6-phosphofructokinase [Suhomyces tanzawaensis NRRL Y-17324]
MPSVDPIQGISFTSLVTNDPAKYAQLGQFYHQLGFRLTKNYSKVSNNGAASASNNPRLHLGISNDSLNELWVESFPLQNVDANGHILPWQELPVYNGDNCAPLSASTVLKLRLSNLTEVDETPRELCFFSTDLPRVAEILAANNTTFEQQTDQIVARDPLGNRVVFSSRENPLAPRSYASAEEYLQVKSDELLKALHKNDPTANEDKPVQELKKRKKIGVMTSGGDAPGMNPAVRAVVRAAIYHDCDVFAVYEGYEGLVKGGDLLRQMDWNDVRSYLSLGGTAIGTARCAEFREREGRLSAAANMIRNGIDALIVCGGDGSLTGADLFRSDWPSLVQELVDNKTFSPQEVAPYKHLTIVGLVGSIDNDMACTDSTIGAYSSLERITEMVDYIDATATSHSRAFVVEVMGRHCGWLGLMSGLSTGADYIFIPERPPKAGEWHQELKNICSRHKAKGKRRTIVIVAEGAIDDQLNAISADQVKDVLVELGLDTRITTLGHVQRGGTAVASDRLLATLQGVDAVKAVLENTPDTPLPMIGVLENKIVRQPLMEAVRLTKSVATAIESKDFDKAMQLRDSTFAEAYDNYLTTALQDDGLLALPEDKRLNIGIVHVGASSAGLNSCTRAAALYCLSKGHRCYAIHNGFSGLISEGKLCELDWLDVEDWHNKGGSEIGTNRSLPLENFGKVAYHLQKHALDGLILIGGFEAFTALNELNENRANYPVFEIPMVMIPATVSNNVPGTEYSLGSDTCLNQLVNYCDAVQQSASSSRRRVFVVEVQGGHSGFVASYCGLITGAIATYTPESKINLKTIQEDISLLYDVFANDRGEDHNGKLIVRNEQASSVYSTELIADIIKESAKGRFETRTAIPGHVQQGYTPSSMDRVNAVRFAVRSIQFIEERTSSTGSGASAVVLGVQGAQLQFSDINELYTKEANVGLRKGKTVHWESLREVGDMLSGRLMLREKRGEV